MDLSHLRLQTEDDDSWTVLDGRSGRSFPVAKKGLSRHLSDRIVQHFAQGGEVSAPRKLEETDPSAGMEISRAPEKLDESDPRTLKQRIDAGVWATIRALDQAGVPSLSLDDVRKAVLKSFKAMDDAGLPKVSPDDVARLASRALGLPPANMAQMGQAVRNMPATAAKGIKTATASLFGNPATAPAAIAPPRAPIAPPIAPPQMDFTIGRPRVTGRLVSTTPQPMGLTIGTPQRAPLMMSEGGDVPEELARPMLLAPPADGVPTNLEARTRMLMERANRPPPAPTVPEKPAPWLPPPGPAVPVDVAPEAPAIDTSVPIQAPPRSAVASMGGGMQDFGMRAAYGQAVAAERAKADVAAQKALVDEKAAVDRIARDTQVQSVWDQRYQENVARTQKLQADVASGQIDPQRWWNDQSVGGGLGRKVTASIALILGGLGEAFGGGPNQALRHINTEIERSIDAQKANLGKKQTLLGYYVQQGHDIQQAKRLALADTANMYAAELDRNKAKFGKPEAMATADATIAALNGKAAADRQQAFQQGFQNQLSLLDRARLEEEAQGKLTKAILDRSGLVAPGWRKNPDIPIGDDEAKAFRQGIAAGEKIKTESKELIRLIKAHGAGIGNNLGLPSATKRRMNNLATSIMLGVNTGVVKLGALAGHDVGFLQDLASNPTTDMRPEAWAQHTANYERLLESIDETTAAAAASMGLPRDPTTAIRSREEQLEAAARGRR